MGDKLALGKRGYAYWVEIVLSVIIIGVVLVGYVESDQAVIQYKQQENMRATGWQIMKNLDDLDRLDTTNFTKVERYVGESLLDISGFDLEYYNSTGCYAVDNGTLGSVQTYCTSINATTGNDVVSVFYTRVRGNESESVRLYVWRKL